MSLKTGSYIAIEGAIGVGKSSLAKFLAGELEADLVVENPGANPFLADYYRDPPRWAFQTQITFLLQRHRQLAEFKQINLFRKTIVSDYLFDKDRLFAAVTLQDREFHLYKSLADALEADVPQPDLVIFLQAPVERLMTNLRIRDVPFERQITQDYLASICETYNNFFFHWDRSPLLMVNAARIDFVKNEDHRKQLLDAVLNSEPGTTYLNPEA